MDAEPKIEIQDFSDAVSGSRNALHLDLPPNVVRLWWRSLEAQEPGLQTCIELLSREEQERASRFRADHARDNFILTRGALRFLLAAYLQTEPQELRFALTKYGKPFLDGPQAARGNDLRFNVSHSHGLALLGFVRGREIGVDVERLQPQLDTWKLAERFFSVHERDALRDLRSEELQTAFFRCWSRKEAYIKARGEGLSLPLSQFDVSIAPNESRALLATRPDETEAARWVLRDVGAPRGYAAACAFSVFPVA